MEKGFWVECLYHPGGDYVYQLPWRPTPKIKYRKPVILAPWIQGPRPSPPIPVNTDQAGEGLTIKSEEHQKQRAVKKPLAKPQEEQKRQPATVVQNAEEPELHAKSEEAPENPLAKATEDLVEEAAEHVVDAVLPGAGAVVMAAEVAAAVTEVVQQPRQPAAPQQHIITPTPTAETDVWLERRGGNLKMIRIPKAPKTTPQTDINYYLAAENQEIALVHQHGGLPPHVHMLPKNGQPKCSQ